MLATNQDRITWNVAITRQDDKGLFNIIAESSYGSDTPSDTEWAYGTTEDLPNLSFSTWHYWHGGNPPNTVGEPAVLHLITDDIYIDIMFTSWTSGEDEGGGGFTYDRAQSPIVVTLNSNRVVFVLQGTAFDDPGATAVAAGGSPLSVSVAGTVDTSELGEYTLTYAAFDGLGNVGFVQRIVKVVTSVPVPEFWTRLVVPFAKQNYADWELPENQDRLTANVWLTRQDDRGLFNYSLESEYNSSTPSDTEWAYGDIADFSELTYMTWHEWSRLNGDTPSILGGDAVLHLISEDIYIPVKFTSWTSGEGVGGGGFSYERGGVVFVTMAGASSMPVLLGDTFTDPGASAVDVDGNPLTVVTNGVVDTGTPGIYVISYSATDARGRCGIAKRYVDVVTSMPKIWSGARKTFTKADYADWTLPENQDLVTTTVAITRQDDHGLFNIINESEYASATPSDTEWAYGTTADLFSLSFTSWHDWARSLGDTTSIIGRDAVMHIISEDIYIDVKFTAWTSNANGGGFSYERAQAPVTLTMHGPAEKFIIQGDSFVDPGADAVDSDLNVLPVTVDGAVDVNVLGDYVLTYTASNLGYTSTVTRLVHVVLTIPPPKLAIMPSYTRQVTYGNAALNEPITVWGRAWAVLATPCNYEINFGDGSVETGAVANASFIGAEHTYVSGGSKTVTLTLTDGNGSVISRQAVIKVFPTPTHEQRINMAIEKGLLWIYRNQKTKDATRVYWEAEDERGVGATAASLLSFLENGHAAANDYEQDIYAQTVQKGLNWQLNNSNVGYFDIYAHSDGLQMRDPDSNGNGKGIYLQSDTYASAYAAIAVILSQPNAQAASNTFVTSGPFVGRSYYDVIQDLYDQFSFSQGDGAHRGGWQYSQLTTDAGSFDGSAQQWPCLVFLAGTERLGLAPQQWVIDNAIWAFDQLQDASSGGVGYGNSGNWQNIAKTGGFLTACKLAGRSVTNDLSVQKALGFIGDNWYAQGGATPGGWAGEFYAMYGSKKGMMFQEVENVVTPTGVRNWYNDMSAWLLGTSEG
ncbi:MAG: immunoglobulin-like domain-containing protein, partial [bacterium]